MLLFADEYSIAIFQVINIFGRFGIHNKRIHSKYQQQECYDSRRTARGEEEGTPLTTTISNDLCRRR
jgi:hypothetical protein